MDDPIKTKRQNLYATDIRTSPTYWRLKELVKDLPEDRKAALGALLEELKEEERQKTGSQLLSVSQLAEQIGVHRTTILRWIKDNAIAAQKFGQRGRYFIPISEKDRLLKFGLPSAPPPPRNDSEAIKNWIVQNNSEENSAE